MNTQPSPSVPPTVSGLRAAAALCAGAAILMLSGTAFAQIDPGVKPGATAKVNRSMPTDQITHNPPGDKCGHNPPADKIGTSGDTRMLLPAVKLAGQAKSLDTPQINTAACPAGK
ncbi:MAG: hypothetical protein V4858_07000 [Pseudomonadota bacterium]